MRDKILTWFANGRTGASSEAMAGCIAGIEGGRKSFPLDPADFNRCLLFLAAVPEARDHLDEVATISPVWGRLVARWDEIEKTFLDEAGLDWCKSFSAPETYRLMQEIIRGE